MSDLPERVPVVLAKLDLVGPLVPDVGRAGTDGHRQRDHLLGVDGYLDQMLRPVKVDAFGGRVGQRQRGDRRSVS